MVRRQGMAAQSGRPAPTRRRTRPTVVRRAPGTMRRADLTPPAPRASEETDRRPAMSWVLVEDANGRMRPEARWI